MDAITGMFPLFMAAFVLPTISAGMATSLLSIAAGYAGQWGKAHPGIDNRLVQGALLVTGIALYLLSHHAGATDANWLENGVMWVFAIPGYATVFGTFGAAPPTFKEVK